MSRLVRKELEKRESRIENHDEYFKKTDPVRW